MKVISGFESKAPSAQNTMLPKGLYIAQIKAVKLEGQEPDQQIVLRVDIIEGDFANYYTDRYNSDKEAGGKYEVRYKGDYKLQIPAENNPKRQHFDWDYRTFQNAIWAIEDSNDGYHWNWDENTLKGKTVGINVREGSYNGFPYTKIGRLESVKMIRAGKCKVMKDLKPQGETVQNPYETANGAFTPVEDEEIPF